MGVACVDVLAVWLESSLMVVGERPDLSTLFTGVASAGQTIVLLRQACIVDGFYRLIPVLKSFWAWFVGLPACCFNRGRV